MTPLVMPFIGKILLFFLLLCVERVIGFPFISSYLFWNDTYQHNWVFEIVLTFLFFIFTASLFGLNIFLIVFFYLGIKIIFSSSFFRKMSILQLVSGIFFVSLLYWGDVTKTPRTLVFSAIQIIFLITVQLQLVSNFKVYRKRLVSKKA